MPPSGIGLERSSSVRPLVFSSICHGLPKVGQAVEHGHPGVRRNVAALGKVAQDAVERDADLAHLVGQVEQRPVLPVPAGQPEIPVEDGDALFHLVERDLQQVAIVLQRLGGVVEQAERILRAICRGAGTAATGSAAPRTSRRRWPAAARKSG